MSVRLLDGSESRLSGKVQTQDSVLNQKLTWSGAQEAALANPGSCKLSRWDAAKGKQSCGELGSEGTSARPRSTDGEEGKLATGKGGDPLGKGLRRNASLRLLGRIETEPHELHRSAPGREGAGTETSWVGARRRDYGARWRPA